MPDTSPTPVEINDADRAAGVDHWIRNAAWWNTECRAAWASRDALIAEVRHLRAAIGPDSEWQCPGCGATTRARMADRDKVTVDREAVLQAIAFIEDSDSLGLRRPDVYGALLAALSEPPEETP